MNHAATIAEIESLDSQRCNAIIKQDFEALGKLLSDDLRYVHSSAVLENKQQYLEKLGSGHYVYQGFTQLARECRVHGDVVLVNGDLRIEVTVKGTAKVIISRYLQVWAKTAAGWQMAAWQSTPVPAA